MSASPPSSALRICRRAFAEVEHTAPLVSFDDGSAEADDAQLHYEPARRQCLDALDWRFASRLYTAAEIVTAPALAGMTPVLLQPEILRVRELPDLPHARYRREGPYLYTDAVPPYTYRATVDILDPTQFSPGFESALVFLIASRLAPSYTTSANRAERKLSLYEATLDRVAPIEAIEATPESYTASETGNWTATMSCGYTS